MRLLRVGNDAYEINIIYKFMINNFKIFTTIYC